jgi:hypothetical protein
VWTIELKRYGHYLDDPALNTEQRWAAYSRVEAEMLAAAELVERGLSANEAAWFASKAGRQPVHTLRGSDPDRLPRELGLRIYRHLWRWP